MPTIDLNPLFGVTKLEHHRPTAEGKYELLAWGHPTWRMVGFEFARQVALVSFQMQNEEAEALNKRIYDMSQFMQKYKSHLVFREARFKIVGQNKLRFKNTCYRRRANRAAYKNGRCVSYTRHRRTFMP